MATATLTSPAHQTRSDRQADKPAHADPGPGLFLAAPISLAANIILVVWLSLSSFSHF